MLVLCSGKRQGIPCTLPHLQEAEYRKSSLLFRVQAFKLNGRISEFMSVEGGLTLMSDYQWRSSSANPTFCVYGVARIFQHIAVEYSH